MKLNQSKEWFEKHIELEGDLDCTVGGGNLIDPVDQRQQENWSGLGGKIVGAEGEEV